MAAKKGQKKPGSKPRLKDLQVDAAAKKLSGGALNAYLKGLGAGFGGGSAVGYGISPP